MAKLRVHNGAWVLIGDGRKCLILHNEGDAELLNLRRTSERDEPRPPTRALGADRPGRAYESMGAARSAVGSTDWHEIEEQDFARTIAAEINAAAQARRFRELVVVAPPRTLAELRRDFSDETRRHIVAEIDKDLTKHPLDQIERLLAETEI